MICARRWVTSIVFVLFATVGAITETAKPDISRTVNEVELKVVATNAMGQPVANLSAADIRVTENGRPISQFAFTSASNLPLVATLVYDTSESNEKAWQKMKPAVVNFLRQTITDDDQLRIAAFENQLEFDVPAKGILQVRHALSAQPENQHVTAFNDSLVKALRTQAEASTTPHRAAMIVFSDGEDNYSLHGPLDVLAGAQRAKIAVYTIRRFNKRSWGNGGLILHALATQTGGRDFNVRNTRELERALAVISAELRSCYVLNYPVPQNRTDTEFRAVTITPKRNKRLRIQAQSGYYVPVSTDLDGE